MRSRILTLILVCGWFLAAASQSRAQIFENLQQDHRAVFSWEMTDELRSEAQGFSLLVDEQVIFDTIPNQETTRQGYTLMIDEANNQYQLVFEDFFGQGEHSWQIQGQDQNGKIFFQTAREPFTVGSELMINDYSWQTVRQVLSESLQLVISVIVTAGSVVFVLLFAFFFILDLILSKGAMTIMDKIGWGGKNKKVGYVYNTRNNQGVPFCLITVTGTDSNGVAVYKTSVSDVNGFYNSVTVPSGKYTLIAKKQNYFFPTKKARSPLASERDFYKGEIMEVAQEWQMLNPLIPLDPVMIKTTGETKKIFWEAEFWRRWQNLKKKQPFFESILFVLSLIALLVEPSWFFVVVAVLYGILVLRRLIKKLKPPTLAGSVLDQHGIELTGVVVEVTRANSDSSFELMEVTDGKGHFAFNLTPGTYFIRAKKDGYVAESEGRAVTAGQTVEVTQKTTFKILKLILIPKLSEDFFFRSDEVADEFSPTPQSDPPPDRH